MAKILKMNLKGLLMRIVQGVIVTLIILFFLALGLKLPLTPRGFELIRSFHEFHFLKALLIVIIISLLLTFLYGKINKECLTRLASPFERIKEGHLLTGIFILSLILNCLVAYFVFEGLPFFIDDLSYLEQAKTFSTGRLYITSFIWNFYPFHIIKDAKFFTIFLPGFSLILALAILVKMPLWLVNPILGALSLVLIYLLGRELYNKRIAVYASVLGLLSPFFLVHNGMLLSETATLFFLLLFILFFIRMIKEDGSRYPILSGLSLGAAFITRPYSALLAGLPFFIYLFYLLLKRNRDIFKKACLFSAGPIIFLLLFLWYNWQLTGSPFTPTYRACEFLKFNYPGFHRMPFSPAPLYKFNNADMFGPIEAAFNLNRVALILNRFLFAWPASLIFIFIPFLFMRKNKWDILLFFLFFSIALGHFFYWGGLPRYWHAALPALLLLTARGITLAPLLLKKIGIPEKTGKRFIITFVIICFLYGFFFLHPSFWKDSRNFCYYGKKRLLNTVRSRDIHNAIVFMRPVSLPSDNLQPSLLYPPVVVNEKKRIIFPIWAVWAAGLSQNSPLLQDDVLYATDAGKENIAVMKEYPGRRYFIYEYNYTDRRLDKLYEVYGG